MNENQVKNQIKFQPKATMCNWPKKDMIPPFN